MVEDIGIQEIYYLKAILDIKVSCSTPMLNG